MMMKTPKSGSFQRGSEKAFRPTNIKKRIKKRQSINIKSDKFVENKTSQKRKIEFRPKKEMSHQTQYGNLIGQMKDEGRVDKQSQETYNPVKVANSSGNSEKKPEITSKRLPQQSLSNWDSFGKKQKSIPNEKREVAKERNSSSSHHGAWESIGLAPEENKSKGETHVIAIDCEMVMCERYPNGPQHHELARVSIVNYNGHVLLDQYVRPTMRIVNYLTWVSGITFDKVQGKPNFADIKEKVFSILKNKTIVGHTLKSDFEALNFTPNLDKLRDLSKLRLLKDEQSRVVSLKKMTAKYLKVDIQKGQHSSVEDARASMYIYKKFEKDIEQEIKNNHPKYMDIKSKLLEDINLEKK